MDEMDAVAIFSVLGKFVDELKPVSMVDLVNAKTADVLDNVPGVRLLNVTTDDRSESVGIDGSPRVVDVSISVELNISVELEVASVTEVVEVKTVKELVVSVWLEVVPISTIVELVEMGEDVMVEDVPLDGGTVVEVPGVLEPAGHTSWGANSGPFVIGLHPGNALIVPCTASSSTDGCSGQVRAKLTSLLGAR